MNHDYDDNTPIAIPYQDLKALAATLAVEMRSAGGNLPAGLRTRFIDVRAALFQRGIFDPVLVRFDSATVARASVSEIAAQLESVAASL